MDTSKNKPQVVVLGGNFAGLGAAQKIREYAGDACDITLIDRKAYLDFIPNISLEAFEGRDPSVTMHMDLVDALAKDDIRFMQAEITELDIDAKTVSIIPNERPGAPKYTISYDYVVIALGARLAYDDIEGFAEYGHAVSDAFQANRLMDYLKNDYKGGPIVVGSDRFEQGQKGRPDWLPTALAACEGPPVEVSLSLGHWLSENNKGGPKDITIFTPAELIAEDAGEKVVGALLEAAGSMGFNYVNKVEGIKRITADTIEFTDGRSLPAELKVLLPNWKPHAFLKGLSVSDEVGFIITDMRMRNPDHPEVFACGDAAALTVPKLGAIGHQECDVVGRQIAGDLGKMSKKDADVDWHPEVICIGDMGGGKGFYIHATSFFGGDIQELRMGKMPYMQKIAYKEIFFRNKGRVPSWGVPISEWSLESLMPGKT